MTTNPDLKEALEFDPLAEAEKITGKDYHDSPSTSALGLALAMKQREEKDALLFLNRDTSLSNSWKQQIAVIEDLGFERKLSGPIEGTPDIWCIYWRPGLLLFCESYNGTSMNSGAVYFNYCGPRSAMFKCSSGRVGDLDGQPVWLGSYDVREGLRFCLDEMEAQGKFLPVWMDKPFMWLVTYQESAEHDDTFDAITGSRLELLGAMHPEIKEAIRGQTQDAKEP